LLAKLATYGPEKRERDSEYVKQYRQALLDGKLVLAIADKGEQLRDPRQAYTEIAKSTFPCLV
jgi:hypothetical protein